MPATAAKLKMYGATWCNDCARIKKFLGEHHIDYDWIDVDRSAEGAEEVASLNQGMKTIPTLVFADGSVLTDPKTADVAAKLGLPESPEQTFCDLAIIGAGPTGLAAAIYTTREDIETILYEKKIVGGLASITDTIDNYPGFPDGVGGIKLAEDMEKQARRFGAEFKLGVEVKGIEDEGRYKKLVTTEGDHYAKTVLIGVGTDYRRLNVPGEQEYISRGIHFCATCDGPFYRDKELIVVGGGNSALQETMFLSKFATKITILVRGKELTASEVLINKIETMKQVEVVFGINTTAIKKTPEGKMVIEADSPDGKADFTADGIFVFIGLVPNTSWLKGIIKLDARGFVVTDRSFETSMPGVFAAGDVRSGSTLQIASAVGEGVTAALMVREYLRERG